MLVGSSSIPVIFAGEFGKDLTYDYAQAWYEEVPVPTLVITSLVGLQELESNAVWAKKTLKISKRKIYYSPCIFLIYLIFRDEIKLDGLLRL